MAHSVLRSLLNRLPDANRELRDAAAAIDAESHFCRACGLPLQPDAHHARRFCDRACRRAARPQRPPTALSSPRDAPM